MPYPDKRAAHGQPAEAAHRRTEDTAPLILTELSPQQVIDSNQQAGQAVELLTFGTVREVCPTCQGSLKLILRQSSVRVAHLFCAGCATCYDAQYADGAPALTI